MTDGTIQKAVYQYHNLLQKTGNGPDQTYFWDGNVAGMEEEGKDYFYFQDDLGSPMRLMDEAGRSEEAYGFDEFGNDIRTAKDIFQDSIGAVKTGMVTTGITVKNILENNAEEDCQKRKEGDK